MFLIYYGGQKYQSHCHGDERETWINIRCEDQGEVERWFS